MGTFSNAEIVLGGDTWYKAPTASYRETACREKVPSGGQREAER